MDEIPADFQELAEALDDPESSAWSVGSAEGGWKTPSIAEWGTVMTDETGEDDRKPAAASAAAGAARTPRS